MKMILPALLATLLAPASHAAPRAAEISSIDCLASNGVILKGTAADGEALKVHTQWGLFTEDFTASLAASSTADTTYINLDSKDDHYIIALDASATRTSEVQKASGTILQPSTVRGLQPAVVAYVRCDLRLR